MTASAPHPFQSLLPVPEPARQNARCEDSKPKDSRMSDVRDNAEQHRFELPLGAATAFIDYHRAGNVVTMVHAEVPAALSGKGLGSQLARGALDLVRARGEKVVPQCSFIAAFIQRNPTYKDLLAR
jgi:predicted GNAT family acetyltransferase